MRKLVKNSSLIFLIVCVILLLLAFGLGLYIHRTLEDAAKEELPFFQSIQMGLTLNLERENERQLKEVRLKKAYHHITIYYPDDYAELLPLTKETLDWAIRKNEEIFGLINAPSVDIIVMEDKDELRNASGLTDISGFYSDSDKLIAIGYNDKEGILEKRETSLYFFQKSILHEYTHYSFSRMVDGAKFGISAYPTWFVEGIAEYIGNDQTNVEYSGFKLVPFSQLISPEQWQTARFQDGTEVYYQSYFAIKYLTDRYGEGVLSDIIQETNETGDFEASFVEVTRMSIEDLENFF